MCGNRKENKPSALEIKQILTATPVVHHLSTYECLAANFLFELNIVMTKKIIRPELKFFQKHMISSLRKDNPIIKGAIHVKVNFFRNQRL